MDELGERGAIRVGVALREPLRDLRDLHLPRRHLIQQDAAASSASCSSVLGPSNAFLFGPLLVSTTALISLHAFPPTRTARAHSSTDTSPKVAHSQSVSANRAASRASSSRPRSAYT